MNISNSKEVKKMLIWCFICLLAVAISFVYIIIAKHQYNLAFYFVPVYMIYFMYVNYQDIISVFRKYEIKNGTFYVDNEAVDLMDIKSIERIYMGGRFYNFYLINAGKKYLFESGGAADPYIQEYLNKVIECKRKGFEKVEKNSLFTVKYVPVLVLTFAYEIINLAIKIKTSRWYDPLDGLLGIILIFLLLGDIFYMLRLKRSYFNRQEIYYPLKHFSYDEIQFVHRKYDYSMKATTAIELGVNNKKIKLPYRFIKFDYITEQYISSKIINADKNL